MVKIEDLIISTLSPLGYPIFRQGSLAEDAPYPEHFFTFYNNAADGDRFYNNSETVIVWDYDLNFYSIDPEKTHSMLLEAKTLLKKVGFTITGAGYDVESDESTHTGRGINIFYVQKQ